ncbi:DUF1318 domain-containing protein [Pseudodesulfovibrio sp. JC047]|uniref:YdbL family protein n=1 Tax=Pseudodesulfovibrio sp. JC047 TaxID=2683199 RepID=UPI0013CF509C|nr:YdbL family protein [Pseudodesulfovibrio sp. JC047]NDV18612.1 DUF1318 domain-containing protein [Pseudodesulfovibrio sp. JC047]
MRNNTRLIILTALVVCLVGSVAFAGPLKDRIMARKPAVAALLADGTVGENNQGLLEFRGPRKQADVVAAENKDRTTVYQAIAKKTGTSPQVVGQRRAAKVAQSARPGTWIQDANGRWSTK